MLEFFLFHSKWNIGVFDKKEHQKRSDQKINQGRKYLTIEDPFEWQVFNVFDFQPSQDWIEQQWSDQILNQPLNQCPYFGSNKQSYRDTNDIILREKIHKFFDHSQRKKK